MTKRALLTLLLVAMVSAFARSSNAQELVYEYARPGYATNTVYIWGAVATPGVWRIEQNVDLIELLSAAVPAGLGTEEQGVRQEVVLRIYRKEGGRRLEIYNESLDQLLVGAQNYPTLQDGDVLELEVITRRSIGWQTIVALVGTASSFTLLLLNIANLTQ